MVIGSLDTLTKFFYLKKFIWNIHSCLFHLWAWVNWLLQFWYPFDFGSYWFCQFSTWWYYIIYVIFFYALFLFVSLNFSHSHFSFLILNFLGGFCSLNLGEICFFVTSTGILWAMGTKPQYGCIDGLIYIWKVGFNSPPNMMKLFWYLINHESIVHISHRFNINKIGHLPTSFIHKLGHLPTMCTMSYSTKN